MPEVLFRRPEMSEREMEAVMVGTEKHGGGRRGGGVFGGHVVV